MGLKHENTVSVVVVVVVEQILVDLGVSVTVVVVVAGFEVEKPEKEGYFAVIGAAEP